jgi:hypothetical protein
MVISKVLMGGYISVPRLRLYLFWKSHYQPAR